ncbi:MAG: hypothetical protein AB4372_23670, partial [Xenococcus sp. (in: cyanobacteria)]
EKAGTGEDVPIRIIDQETLLRIWQPGIFRYELRRLHQDALLPHPKEIFSLDSSEIKSQLFPGDEISLNTTKNTTITWDLESKSLSSISWFYLRDISLSRDSTGKGKLAQELYQPLLTDN